MPLSLCQVWDLGILMTDFCRQIFSRTSQVPRKKPTCMHPPWVVFSHRLYGSPCAKNPGWAYCSWMTDHSTTQKLKVAPSTHHEGKSLEKKPWGCRFWQFWAAFNVLLEPKYSHEQMPFLFPFALGATLVAPLVASCHDRWPMVLWLDGPARHITWLHCLKCYTRHTNRSDSKIDEILKMNVFPILN